MRDEVIEYRCEVRDSKMQLALENWWVGTYPLTYTPQECLEDWCELVGWKFVKWRGGRHIGSHYVFDCQAPKAYLIMDTIYDYSDAHRERLLAGAA